MNTGRSLPQWVGMIAFAACLSKPINALSESLEPPSLSRGQEAVSIEAMERHAAETPGLRDLQSSSWPEDDLEFRLWIGIPNGQWMFLIKRQASEWLWQVFEERDRAIGFELIDEGAGDPAEQFWKDLLTVGIMAFPESGDRDWMLVGGRHRKIQLRTPSHYYTLYSPRLPSVGPEFLSDELLDRIEQLWFEFRETHVLWPPDPGR